MTSRFGSAPLTPEPLPRRSSKSVDKRPRGLGKLAVEALDAERLSPSAPATFTYEEVLRGNTGRGLEPSKWARRTLATSKLAKQSAQIAAALKRAGENVYREANITLISSVTGIVETLPVYRACRFIPVIAARDRKQMINGLKLFTAEHQFARRLRFAVLTHIAPVPAGGKLREAIQDLSRRLSRWAHQISEPVDQGGFDAEVLFRGIEFTRRTAEERGMLDQYPADTILYHVHANVIFRPKRKLKGDIWRRFLRYTRSVMKAEWSDRGAARNPIDVIRYCIKPNDVTGATDGEIAWLHNSLKRLKLAQPMGEFKKWSAEIKKRKLKIANVNFAGKSRMARVQRQQRKKRIEVDRAQDAIGNSSALSDAVPEKAPLGRPEKAINVLLGVSLPQWRHTPWAEPMIIVQGYEPQHLPVDVERKIVAWRDQARVWWDVAGAPAPEIALMVAQNALDCVLRSEGEEKSVDTSSADYSVHSCRPTVQRTPMNDNKIHCSPLPAPRAGAHPGCEIPRNDRDAVMAVAAEELRRLELQHGGAELCHDIAKRYSASYLDDNWITGAELLASANAAPEWMRAFELILPGRWLSSNETAAFCRVAA